CRVPAHLHDVAGVLAAPARQRDERSAAVVEPERAAGTDHAPALGQRAEPHGEVAGLVVGPGLRRDEDVWVPVPMREWQRLPVVVDRLQSRFAEDRGAALALALLPLRDAGRD